MREAQAADGLWMAEWEKGERPYPWTAQQFKGALIYEENGKPAGYVVFNTVQDEAHLLNIMVHQKMRRKGIGKRILKEAEALALARGARYMVLDVDPRNTPAVALYKNNGYVVLERRVEAYPDGEDALIMKKELS
jgi:ribosomal-protein-alanine N-acetyltransferase